MSTYSSPVLQPHKPTLEPNFTSTKFSSSSPKMISTQHASASLSREKEIRQLRQRFAGHPIGPPPPRKRDSEIKSLLDQNPELKAQITEFKQLIASACISQDLQIASATTGQIDKNEAGEAEPEDARGNGEAPNPQETPEQAVAQGKVTIPTTRHGSTSDIIGVSILGAAIFYHYSSELLHLASLPFIWAYSLLPNMPDHSTPELTIQHRVTLIFLLLPIWAALARATIIVSHWIFLLIENNRLKSALRKHGEINEWLEKAIALNKKCLEIQKQIVETKERVKSLYEKENVLLVNRIERERGRGN
ncbi:MAG: hypothetical protein Q9224_006590 [Gallowayella concinna]